MQILLLPLGGHAHLAEPGCLCTMSRASKAPGAGLGTRMRTGLSSQQVVWAPEVPPGPLLFMRKGLEFAPQQMPGIPITAGWMVGGAGRRQMENQMKKCQSWA